MQETDHRSVLLQEAVTGLSLAEGDTVLDATLGLGGHSLALASEVGSRGHVIGIDADRQAIVRAKARLEKSPSPVTFVQGNFRDLKSLLESEKIYELDGALFDLGWNSTQLSSGRGFSFNADEPLLMTLDDAPPEGSVTARTIVNEWGEEDLFDIIHTLGEERFAKRIAHAIVVHRKEAPIETARALADVIADAVPTFYRKGKIHPATKTFQALRMMVNEELASLQSALADSLRLVKTGKRIAVITFHSLEDGLVKRLFRQWSTESLVTLVTKKPIIPKREEIITNPRARSAKLRIIQKL